MNGDMFNTHSALKQTEKLLGLHKIRGKEFKAKQKIPLSQYIKSLVRWQQ